MQLDFIENINEFGEHTIRLYSFGMEKAILFRDAVQEFLKSDEKQLNLTSLDFIEMRNCALSLRKADEDIGITTDTNIIFYCDLTPQGFEEMLKRLAPFCEKETKGYQWLYEIDTPIDFLFSPAGTW